MLYNMDDLPGSCWPAEELEIVTLKPKFKYLGKNVLISDKAVFYNSEKISIGDNSRIDDFAILSAGGEEGIKIGRYVHIACYVSIIGKGQVTIEDYAGLSSRVAIYSSTDDYDGQFMTNPCIPEPFRSTQHGHVYIGKHVVVGTGSTILPHVCIDDGCAVGAMSLVNHSFGRNLIIAGIPAKFKKNRETNIYKLEYELNKLQHE